MFDVDEGLRFSCVSPLGRHLAIPLPINLEEGLLGVGSEHFGRDFVDVRAEERQYTLKIHYKRFGRWA